MSYPNGVSLAVITAGTVSDFFGGDSGLSATATPVLSGTPYLVHAATGSVLVPTPVSFTAGVGESLAISVPHTDQEGWLDAAGNAFKGWAYNITVVAGKGYTWSKTVSPVIGQDLIDLDLVRSSGAGTPIIGKVPTVMSVVGKTGAITAQDLVDAGVGGVSDWAEITGKPEVFPAAAPTWSEVTEKPATFPATWEGVTGKPSVFPSSPTAWSDVTGKPATFAPAAHTHAWSDVAGKPSVFPPAAHTHTITDVTGLDKVAQAVNTKTVIVTPERFGVDPTGLNDSTAGIRQALAAVPAGGTLYFPKGTYAGQAIAPTSESDYIVVDKPITITGDVETVLRDVRFYIKGTFDAPVYLGAAATEGDQTITTAAAHGWAPGDYVQVLSQYNAYTEDAGAYQLGSINPTLGTTPVCQVSEIHRVAATPSTTSVRFLDLLMYGGYTTSAAPTPIPGITGAQARRIKPVKGVRITGLTFENRVQGYRCILARGAADLVFEDCSFYSDDNPGFALRIFDTYNLVVRGCRFEKRTDTFSGSSWNSVIIGGGCTDVTFAGCTVTGEAQALDISPNAGVGVAADPGGTLTEYRSTQRIRLIGNTFLNCSDGATTHPGTMDVLIAGNHVTGGSTGFRVRSRRAQILSNNIQTSRRGVALSAFVTQTLIYGNHFLQITSSKYTGFYAGVEYSASSSEITSDNRAQMDISGNVFTVVKVTGAANYAVITNYSEPSSSSVTLTDEWRNRKSDIVVANNAIRGGTILTANVTHGAKVIGNTFSGGTTMTHYVMLQGTASVVHNNIFDDYTGHVRCYATPRSGSTYTHPVENQIGSNATTGAAMNYTLANAKTMLVKVGV